MLIKNSVGVLKTIDANLSLIDYLQFEKWKLKVYQIEEQQKRIIPHVLVLRSNNPILNFNVDWFIWEPLEQIAKKHISLNNQDFSM